MIFNFSIASDIFYSVIPCYKCSAMNGKISPFMSYYPKPILRDGCPQLTRRLAHPTRASPANSVWTPNSAPTTQDAGHEN